MTIMSIVTNDDLDSLASGVSNDYDFGYHELATQLKCSIACASDVAYLRTRHRHTVELENELIRLHSINQAPNIYEYGVTKETQESLLKAVDSARTSMIDTCDDLCTTCEFAVGCNIRK